MTEVGESARWAVVTDGVPHRAVGGRLGRNDGGGDGDGGVGEDAPGGAVAPGRWEGEEDPGGMSDGSGEACVAVELSGEAGEGLGAGVVLEAEGQADSVFDPDGVGVGADTPNLL